ncbi:MAG: class I SAM-dependent methyltransferase [Hyphomonadaceae bacterium]|nr:class I SAM-dependent methyltransferase [Hyphomonadaceae bacterium]
MQEAEAKWIESTLRAFPPEDLSPILDIGSQTLAFRTTEKPYIHDDLFAPLLARGVSIIYSDLQEGEGIDISANLLEEDGFDQIKATAPRTIFCNNVLEHVLDPAEFASRCYALLPPGGRLVITVPKSYPHHRDPIDTMFRPSPDEICALIDAPVEVLASQIIDTGSYRDNLRKRPWIIYRQLVRLPFPFLGWTKWKRSMKKFYWMIWPYRQSCVVLQKPLSSVSADSGTELPHHDRDPAQPSPGTPAQP